MTFITSEFGMHPTAKEIASFVTYEWEMFCWAVAVAKFTSDSDSEPAPDEWCIESSSEHSEAQNALLEVLLIHARVMREFLFRSRSQREDNVRKDDVLAEDFFDTPEQWKKLERGYLWDNKGRLDKALPHLSYERIGFELTGKKWDIEQIWTELDQAWNSFLTALPDDRRIWFSES